MTATEAATAMNRLAIEMRQADLDHIEHGTAAARRRLDEAITAYRAAGDAWAAAYVLEMLAKAGE